MKCNVIVPVDISDQTSGLGKVIVLHNGGYHFM